MIPINSNANAVSAPSRGELADVVIEKVIFGGDGLARLGGGFVVFVPFSAEGDRLRVRITERKTKHARAEIVEILSPGPARETAPCPYYTRCGGCQYQHLTYAEECRLKENQVREAFARVGKMPEANVLPLIAAPKPYGYRNRITVHAEAGRIGFRGVNGRELVDIRECALARPEVNGELARLRSARVVDGHYSVRDATVPPSGFFQANHDLRETLRNLIAGALPERGGTLLEGYCGGGFFTEIVAARFERVIAVENDPRTLRDAQRLGLANVEWREADVALVLPEELRAQAGGDTAMLLDPPREGLPVRLTEALCVEPVAHLAYVSCDPATLARDARMLSKSYRLVSVQPIDLFPRTAQIECVSVWQRS
ncbi:MAG: TRAM domain-containing protein [Methylacidiphilales bacterium]|nr:TRAM domain-containing protein [Candidatus Methylacidiphilales bacterium]